MCKTDIAVSRNKKCRKWRILEIWFGRTKLDKICSMSLHKTNERKLSEG